MLVSLTYLEYNDTLLSLQNIIVAFIIKCICLCMWVFKHAWLTSDAEQHQDQAAQGQREGGREEAAEERAPDRPHCVLRSTVCMCESVCVDVHTWSMAPLWPCLHCHRQTSPHTLRFVLCNTADTCPAFLQCSQTEVVVWGQHLKKEPLCTTLHHNTGKETALAAQSDRTKLWPALLHNMQMFGQNSRY